MINKLLKYRSDLIFWGLLIGLISFAYILFEVLLPFFLGLFGAFLINPLIKKTQKVIPNRNIATTITLFTSFVFLFGTIWIFSTQISNDFKKLNKAVHSYAISNADKIDSTTSRIQVYIETIYSPEDLRKTLAIKADTTSSNDSLAANTSFSNIIKGLDTEQIKETWGTISALFTTSIPEQNTSHPRKINWFVVIISALGYFMYIIYTLEYFQGLIDKYIRTGIGHSRLMQVVTDIRKTFIEYFKQRSKIVLFMFILYTITFNLLGLPGAILLGFIAAVLCYIAYLQYITLFPIAISCLILSLENGNSFFLLFGIAVFIFIVGSIVEEFLLIPKLMKDVAKMNPAVMTISLAIWSYLLGAFGLLIAIPMTSIFQSYFKLAWEHVIPENKKEG